VDLAELAGSVAREFMPALDQHGSKLAVQIENGRTYLRELVFGDPEEPYHREGLALNARVEAAFVGVLRRDGSVSESDATLLARAISAVMFISITATIYIGLTDEQVVGVIRDHVRVLLPR